MKVALVAAMALVCLLVSLPVIGAGKLGSTVRRAIPSQYDIDDPRYAPARQELEELVADCGPGVVEGVSGDNRCSFKVALDDLFFQAPETKTGLLADDEWMYRDGVTWFEPAASRDTLPDNFDLRDLMKNGQPEIRKQRCGDCWAWSTHHGLEIARAVHDQLVTDHSIQTVLSCSKSGSCGGGYMSAVDFLKHGLPYEPDFPYAGSDRKCKYSSSDINAGWEAKVSGTPYVGSSRDFSIARRQADGTYREGNKVKKMMEAMYQWKSPLVVTVAAYSISGDGIYDSCSAINSGGNHMVAISGWETVNGKRIAHVYNSWGLSHGKNGVSRIQWECGDGRLNRGLGSSAKIVQYQAPCSQPNAAQTYLHQIAPGKAATIGAEQKSGTRCKWTPTEGLENPESCVTKASPSLSTEYHLTAENACGKSTSMTYVQLWGDFPVVSTPDGMIRVSKVPRRTR